MKRKDFSFDDFEEIVRKQKNRKSIKNTKEKKKDIKENNIDIKIREKEKINEMLKFLNKLPQTKELGKAEIEVLVSRFHYVVLKNTQMRSIYPEDPIKFLDSELLLNEAIQNLHEIATVPQFYLLLVQRGTIKDLKLLLMHENKDIIISVIHLIRELTEADVIEENNKETLSVFSLFEEFLENDTLNLLVENLNRLNKGEEDDLQAIYAILTIFDNYSNVDEEYCLLITKKCNLFAQLFYLMRTQKNLDENKLYSAEIMSVYVQIGGEKVRSLWVNSLGIEKTLKLIMIYSNHNNFTSEEHEYLGNLVNIIASALMVRSAKKKLSLSVRAIPVLLEFINKKKLLKQSALKCLDIGLDQNRDSCFKLVEEGGLKIIFSAFMKGRARKRFKQNQSEVEEYLISIILNLFINLQDIPYIRFMGKFNEREFEKIDRLIELHTKNQNYQVLNLIDLVICLVVILGNQRIVKRLHQVLNQQDLNFNEIKDTLKKYTLTIFLNHKEARQLKNIIKTVIDKLII